MKSMNEMEKKEPCVSIYQVLLNQKSRYIDRVFSYTYEGDLSLGTLVNVPFGKGNKIYQGVVVARADSSEHKGQLKAIVEVVEEASALNPTRLELANWIKEQYLSGHQDAIALFYPKSVRETGEKRRNKIRLVDKASLSEAFERLPNNATKKKAFYQYLIEREECYEDEAKKQFGQSVKSYLERLAKDGLVSTVSERHYRRPESRHQVDPQKVCLHPSQEKAYQDMINEIEGDNRPILLHGITGSGKTELYIKLMERTLAQGKGVIVLVPEISLTPQTLSRFRSLAGEDLATLHSGLSKSEKADEWDRIQEIETPVVIGARSALFAPVDKLGLIIIDECHDEAYKSEQSPKYDAVEVAQEMNRRLGCSVVLGTATPKISQYHWAKIGQYHLVSLLERANKKPLPTVEIVNMLDDAKDGNLSFLSNKLHWYMEEELAEGNQVILYINRRGYSSFVTCRSCGHIPRCEHCDISLTYHKEKNVLRCHYCNYERPFERQCPNCHEGQLEDRGMGTQRIDKEVAEYFPKAKIFRMDRDTVKKKGDHDRILWEFRQSEGAVLIGTQMIGKGHDFPRVNVVGIINADQGMYFPDYRSNERTFSSIEQVGGRSGRGDKTGRVVIQTFSPDHHLLRHVLAHDYRAFYEEEIKLRKAYVYPPFGNLLRVLVTGLDEAKTAASAMKIKDAFLFYVNRKQLTAEEVFGPYPCMVAKIEDKHRWQILLKDSHIPLDTMKKILDYILREKRKVVLEPGVYATVDINPSNMA